MHGVRFEVTVAAFLIVILTDALIYCSFQQAIRRPPLTIVFILEASLHLERSVHKHQCITFFRFANGSGYKQYSCSMT